ncbi:kiSS-1 receptor isoform X3 [Nannospalax galili]|uniref:kiSS-1 receptor isoform X3 n=1 Tax=Nannospalax galili TaxID=1026970 RepID=UPI00111C812A|nr:kiSS-1 receptor isoform X3 [Nannospalax galili]
MPRLHCQCLRWSSPCATAPGCLAGPPLLCCAHVARAGGEFAGHLRYLPPQAYADSDQLLYRQSGGHRCHLFAVLRALHGAALPAARLGAGGLHVQVCQLHPAGLSASHMRHADSHERGSLALQPCLPRCSPCTDCPVGLAPTAARLSPAAPWSAPSLSTTCWPCTCCPYWSPAPATEPCCGTWAAPPFALHPRMASCRASCWRSALAQCALRSPVWWPPWCCSLQLAGVRYSCSLCCRRWAPQAPGIRAATRPTRSRSGRTACPTATQRSTHCSTPSWARTSDRLSAVRAPVAAAASARPTGLDVLTWPQATRSCTAWPLTQPGSGPQNNRCVSTGKALHLSEPPAEQWFNIISVS